MSWRWRRFSGEVTVLSGDVTVEVISTEPPLDVYETEDFLFIEVDLPGLEPGNVLIKVVEDILIIEGIREQVKKADVRFLCMERKRDAFRRILKLPVEVDPEGGEAMYNNGVITIKFPKLKRKVVKLKIMR